MPNRLATAPFVGRERALGHLRELFERAAAGTGGLALVTGEPGIGKTRLLQEVAAEVRRGGGSVAWGRCWEGAGTPAFWPWVQVGRACSEGFQLDALAVPGLEADQARFRLFDGMARLLVMTGREAPLLVVLDDLHWADVPSLLLLRFLEPELRAAPLLVVGAYRDLEVDVGDEAGRVLADLARSAQVLSVSGLDHDDVGTLLAAEIGAPPSDAVVSEVHSRSGGNPLFVGELARLLAAQQETGHAGGAILAVPPGVSAVIERRLARLSQRCHDLLSVAAVVGEQFGLDVVEAASGFDRREVLGLVDESVRAGLLLPADEATLRYRFPHALVRDALYASLPLGRRAELHDAVGRVLEARGAADDERVAELAHHFVRATPGIGAERAIEYSERAGRRALAALAYEEAVDHLRRALELLGPAGPEPERRIRLLLGLGEAQLAAGDFPAARGSFTEAARLAAAAGRPEDLAHAALGFGAGLGGFEVSLQDRTQIDLLEQALAALPADDSALRAWVQARLSVALSFVASEERRRHLSEEAVAMARRVGDKGALAHALGSLCDAVAGPEDVDRRFDAASEMVALALDAGDPAMELLGRRFRLVARMERGDMTGADAEIVAFERTAEALGQPLYSWYAPLWRSARAAMAGHLDDAEERVAEAEAIGGRAHSENAVVLCQVARMMLAIERDDAHGVRAFFEEMRAWMPGDHLWMAVGLAWALARAGQRDEAADALERCTASGALDMPRDSEWLPAMCQLMDTCVLVGSERAAEAVYALVRPFAALFGIEGIGAASHGCVSRHLGLLAALLGRREEAETHLAEAVARNRAAGATLHLAHSLAATWQVLGSEAARREALQLYRQMAVTGRAEELEGGPAAAGDTVFRREGDAWVLAYGGESARLRDLKGLHDLAALIARPGTEVHVLELAGRGGAVVAGDAGEVLDAEAKARYEQRLRELDDDLAEAEANQDPERASRARAEREALIDELAAAFGLGGRARRVGDLAERARTAVTWRIRSAIERVESVHPPLGRHLRRSVRTGTFCAYDPEEPVAWSL